MIVKGKKELTEAEKERIEKNRIEALNKLKMKQSTLSFGKEEIKVIDLGKEEEDETEKVDNEEEEEVPLVNKKQIKSKVVTLDNIVPWSNEGSKRKYQSKYTVNEDVNAKLSLWK